MPCILAVLLWYQMIACNTGLQSNVQSSFTVCLVVYELVEHRLDEWFCFDYLVVYICGLGL